MSEQAGPSTEAGIVRNPGQEFIESTNVWQFIQNTILMIITNSKPHYDEYKKCRGLGCRLVLE